MLCSCVLSLIFFLLARSYFPILVFLLVMMEERMVRSASSDPLTNSYLYLHPVENPAAPLVSLVLDSTNYHSWNRAITTALSAKNKVEFVLGLHPCPSKNDFTFSAWTRCNNMVVSWF